MKFKKLSALILGAILTIGVAAGLGAKVENDSALAASGDTYLFSKAAATSGTSTDKIWQFSTAKNSGTSAPAYNTKDSELRLYYNAQGNGCSLTIKLTDDNKNSYNITKIVYTASSTSYTPSIKFFEAENVSGTSTNGSWSSTKATYENANGFKALTIQNVNTANKQLRLKSVAVYYTPLSTKKLSSISVDFKDEYKGTTWYAGDTIQTNFLKVTATYSEGNPVSITDGSGVKINGSDSATLTAGSNNLNISYEDSYGSDEKSFEVIAQQSRTIDGVTLAGDMTKKTYYVGDNWDLSGLYLDVDYSAGENEHIPLTELVNGEDYFLDPETAEDTSITSLYLKGEYEGYDFEGPITGIEVTKATFDVLNRAFTGVSNGTNYASWSGKTGSTGVVYAGQSAGDKDTIQLRSNNSNSGVIATKNETSLVVDKVVVTWHSDTAAGRTLNVYGSNGAYTSPTDLYGNNQGTLLGSIICGKSTELIIDEGNYNYIGLKSSSGAMYLSEIKIYYREGESFDYEIGSLFWESRQGHDVIESTSLDNAFNVDKWEFTAKYNDPDETELNPSPSFGIGEDDVHIGLYNTSTPNNETEALSKDYIFTAQDNGKYLVACYKGVFSKSNNKINIIQTLNSITKVVSGSKEVELDMSKGSGGVNGGGTNGTSKVSYELDGVTLSSTNGYFSGELRSYKDSTLTITSSANIKSIEFTCSSSAYAEVLTTSIDDANAKQSSTVVTWTLGSTSSISITLSGQVRFKNINVSIVGDAVYEYANLNVNAQKAVIEFANFFNTTMTADGACSVDGITDYNSDTFNTAWETVAAKWDELFGAESKLSSEDLAHAKAMFVNADAYWANEFADTDPLQRAMRTYDKVTSNTNLSKFIEGRPKVEDNGVGIKALIDNNATTIALIVIIALFSGFAFLFVSKRKQRKIEL